MTGVIGEEIQQFGRPVHRLDRAQAQARERCFTQDGAHQPLERACRREVAAPAPQVDSGEHQLRAAGRREGLNRAQAGRERHRTAVAARRRNHAEGAAVAAAVLHLQIGARLPASGPGRRPAPGRECAKDPSAQRHRRHRWRPIWLWASAVERNAATGTNPAAGDKPAAGRGELPGPRTLWLLPMTASTPGRAATSLGRALRIAAGYQDACSRVFPPQPAQESSRRAIRLGGDAAGIYHDHIRDFGAWGRNQTAVTQLRADGFAIGPAGAAAKVLDVVSFHVDSLTTSLKKAFPRRFLHETSHSFSR